MTHNDSCWIFCHTWIKTCWQSSSGVLHFKYVFIITNVRGTGVSVVSTVMRLQAGRSGIWIQRRARDFSLLQLLQRVHTGSEGLPSLLFYLVLSSFLWVKWLGCEVDHSPPFSSVVRNVGGGCTLCVSMPWTGTTLSFCINRVRKLLISLTEQTSKQALNNLKWWF